MLMFGRIQSERGGEVWGGMMMYSVGDQVGGVGQGIK